MFWQTVNETPESDPLNFSNVIGSTEFITKMGEAIKSA